MKKFQFNTPVLFMTFNRPTETKKVFDEIKKAKPKKLFISSDGPRNPQEKVVVDKLREYLVKNVDWKCKVKTLFREENLGCKYACAGAISWFFKNVEKGIILEDDCLPRQSFFRFCQEVLEKYNDDERIVHITGTNIDGISDIDSSYLFSNMSNMWGWASWRRAWKMYDIEMKDWPKYNTYFGVKKLGYRGVLSRLKAVRTLGLTYAGKLNTWDYQWEFVARKKKKLSIVSGVNMITNIGIGGGTHTSNYGEEKSFKSYELNFPLVHPSKETEDKRYAKRYAKKYMSNPFKKLVEILKYEMKKLFS